MGLREFLKKHGVEDDGVMRDEFGEEQEGLTIDLDGAFKAIKGLKKGKQ